jgi:sugar O-acyltransferase (sialic acid O-acetyltransferase NeuD family)
MAELIILGAGPHALEMAEMAQQLGGRWQVRGCLVPETQLDSVGLHLGGGLPVLDTYAGLGDYPDACFALEYNCGAPEIGSALLPRDRVVSLIAPGAFVSATAHLGAGCVLYPGCFVGHNARLGDRVFALAGTVINHDCVLEDDVTLCSHASLAGFVHIEADTYLGQACTVRQYLRIGKGSLIGMGAVVISNVPANSIVVGNPARKLRNRA